MTDAGSKERHHEPPNSVILDSGNALHQEGGPTCADGESDGHDGRSRRFGCRRDDRSWSVAGGAIGGIRRCQCSGPYACGCRQANFNRQRAADSFKIFANRQSDACLSVVATLPAGATLNDLTTHLALSGGVLKSLPVVLGLPSTALKGGRPHLVQLGGIRRFAEEWDLSVAIDLSGQFDPTWEAEAAVSRLGERLTIPPDNASAPSRAAVGRDRVACRALHAAMERDHFIEVAVAPVKSVPFPITPRVASYGARRAADYIAERAVLHARALREGISQLRGKSLFSRDLIRASDPTELNYVDSVGSRWLGGTVYRLVY